MKKVIGGVKNAVEWTLDNGGSTSSPPTGNTVIDRLVGIIVSLVSGLAVFFAPLAGDWAAILVLWIILGVFVLNILRLWFPWTKWVTIGIATAFLFRLCAAAAIAIVTSL